MPQRKDTPAARAALARRRQRAAQNLRNPATGDGSTITSATTNATTTTTTTTSATATRPAPPPQAANTYLQSNTTRSNRSRPMIQPTNSNTIESTKQPKEETNIQYAFQQRPMPESKVEAPSRILAASQPLPPTKTRAIDVRTETPAGLSSTPSTVGDFNIETVLKGSHSGEAPSIAATNTSQTTFVETYEKISSFGSVKITAPQPTVPDRRSLPKFPASPKRSTTSALAQSISSGGSNNSKDLQLPSLESKEPILSKPANTSIAAKPQHMAPKPPQQKKPTTNSNYVRATDPSRLSRMPSRSTTVNPEANKLLPRRRSPSPRRPLSPPEKKLSPRRFHAPPRNQSKSPPRPPKAQARKPNTSTTTNREKSKLRLQKPGPEPTLVDKMPAANNTTTRQSTTSSSRSNSISPFRQFPPARPVNPKREQPKTKQAIQPENKVEDLTTLLNDSFSITDASLAPDPALQSNSRHDSKTTTAIQMSSPHSKQEISKPNETTSNHSPFVIRQNVSFRSPETNRYRSDENDARGWNVRPPINPKFAIQQPKSPTKKRESPQNVDASCLHSGDWIMLRSCSTNTALTEKDGFQGLCLGKENETLRIVKAKGFTPLVYGDIVVLESYTTNETKRVLGARKRRNDGKDEICFLDAASTDSSRWVVRSAISGQCIVVGRGALAGENLASESPSPVQSGNSVVLLNCSNGGVLSIRDGVAILRTDSYDPNSLSGTPGLLGRNNDKLEPTVGETFQFLKVSTPPCPTWATPKGLGERYFLNGSYLTEPHRNQVETMMVDRHLLLTAKENILVDEVVGSFLGLEGIYVKLKESEEQPTTNNPRTFQLCDGDGVTFDLSLRNLVDQILPLSTSYVCVRDFIGIHYPGYEYGRVMQAFCEGLDVYLQQFVSFVAQLEQKVRNPPATGALTMKNIHFEITPLLHSMSILQNTTKTVYDKKGGALINALRSLEKRVYMGDTVAKDLLGTLVDRASVPYSEMLSIWLQSGRLHDPFEEFMIKKAAKSGVELDGDTWAEVFMFSEEHVIHDIVRNDKIKNKILVTGKYWNAVQACIVDNVSSEETSSGSFELKKLQFQSDLSGISSYVESMYESASSKLMHILRDQFQLKESLQVMKRYFLLDQGDFLSNFLDASGKELSKPVEEVSIGRVQHLLGSSIQMTESQREDDNFATVFGGRSRRKLSPSNLRCKLSEQSLVSYLDSLYGGFDDRGPTTPSRQKYGSHKQGKAGFDFFEIDFIRVPFPISLIISPTSMENYKLLFRHLFFAKHVERRLVGVWSDHQVLKKLDGLRGLLGPTFLLRQRMQHCVQNLMNYMSFEIVEGNWIEMISSIDISDDAMSNRKQQTVDDLLQIHDGFLQKTMDSCLLTNPVLIKTLIKLLNTCLLFTDQMKRFMDTTKIYDDQFNIAAEKRRAVQRSLNERVTSSSLTRDQKKLQKSMTLLREERDILLQRQTRRVGREICSESYKRMISRFEEVFSADLAVFMRQLNSHTSSGMVTNLGIRLDWNGYVSKKMSVP